jgi:hypothetical protein
MRRTDPFALEAQAAADRDRGGTITAEQCRRQYGLNDDELVALGPPRLGAPQPGSREPRKVYRLESVLELVVERLRPERGARVTQLGTPAAVHDDEAARGAA